MSFRLRCNHCGETFDCPVMKMRPRCPACRDKGHDTSFTGCKKCQQELEEDLREAGSSMDMES